jgi:hypothetical protein
MGSDAYIRIGSRGVHPFGQTEHHESLIFVDVPKGQRLSALRQASYAMFQNAGTLLIRADSPVDSPRRGEGAAASDRAQELKEQVNALKLRHLEVGLLHQPVGQEAWVEGDLTGEQSVLDRACAVELEALLDWGDAVWTPSTYHYRLPSGEHAAGFVRVADAMQRPRDIEVLASWIHASLRDRVGLVVDTGTLSGIVQALLAAIRSQGGWVPGPVNVLDGYPATAIDVSSAVRETNAGSGVIALLSVNSSGRVRDHLLNALAGVPSGEARSLDVLVNKSAITSHTQNAEGIEMRTWHPRPSEEPLVSYEAANASQCELCRAAETATLISVSPRSFDGSLPAALARITPSVEDARFSSRLWQLADAIEDAIRLEATPESAVAEWRPPGQMAIAFDYAQLVSRSDFREAAVAALVGQLARARVAPATADLVLMPEHEYSLPGRAELIKAMKPILGPRPKVAPFPPKGDWSASLKKKVHDAPQCVTVLTLGAVTGTTLQSALSAVQGARDHGGYDLYAYVLHARLADQRAWQTLRNTYGRLLFAAWHSYLPERSPLQDEGKTLSEISEAAEGQLTDPAQQFLKTRVELLGGHDLDQRVGLFWGSKAESELTPNSIFGQGLHAPAVYAAVAASMERARRDQRKEIVPARRVFEMPAILRSYYDPMILAAMLRWLQPHEAWWGVDPNDEGVAVKSLLSHVPIEHLAILVPEFLLAAAQGKVNRAGTTVAQAKATVLLQSTELTDEQKAPIQLALALLPDYGTQDAEHELQLGARAAIERAATAQELLDLVPGLLRDLRAGRLPPALARQLEEKITTLAK